METTLSEAERLHAQGFAIHWLYPKSKRPIGDKWTQGPRKSIEELARSFKPGNNVGVRLGTPSHFEGAGYLAVIDCDVKSSDPKHVKEMQAVLKNIRPDWESEPLVRSGRGNGSMHIYVLTKEPASSHCLAKSPEKVPVYMPSSKFPSAQDRAALSTQELARGMRLRPAWEISLMGTGSQVVLPPSIHPDSGKPYSWVNPISTFCPLEEFTPPPRLSQEAKEPSKFRFKPVDLAAIGVPESIVSLIEDGTDCDDRSGGLFKAAISLVRHGLTDDEIATALTEKGTYLGDATYEHCQSTNRDRAARWVKRYTIGRARADHDDVKSFSVVERNAVSLSMPVRDDSADWKNKLERSSEREGSKPKVTLKNVMAILRGEFGKDVFRLNEFSGFNVHGCNTPWGGVKGKEIANGDDTEIKSWFSNTYRMEPHTNLINEAITVIGRQSRFHPVRDYLDTLTWDGVKRLDTWMERLLEAQAPAAYLKAVSRKLVIAMVARAYEPGCKYDQVVILEGRQGAGKSRSIAALAGAEWFSDAPINLMDKDGVLSMRAIWIMEFGELSGMNKTDVDQLKEFVSRQTDRIRVPYGRHMEVFPRQCVFVGSTNNGEYLRDTTGNRRFWPVSVGRCDVEAVKQERDQLFAEAKFAFDLGEPLWLDDDTAREESEEEQGKRLFGDEWAEVIQRYLKSEAGKPKGERFPVNRFQLFKLFEEVGPLASTRMDRAAQLRAADCLRKIGYKKVCRRDDEGCMKKYWEKV